MLKMLEGLHHWLDQKIAGVSYRQVWEEGLEGSLVVELLESVGMWTLKEYIWRRQDTIM